MNNCFRRAARAVGSLALSLPPLAACHSVPATVTRPRVAATDGVSLAADVILPVVVPPGGVPAVLIQTRYWRSFQLRGGGKKNVAPLGPREAIVERLVQAGFGVVVIDVRGTGASDGTWPWPWSANEVRDMGPIIDWMVAQRWSNGAVGATGVSYEGTTALLSATAGRPALRAILAREVEWNLVDEIIAPGGVRNVGFVDAWSRSVNALDHGKLPELFPPLARLGIKGVQPTDDDPRADALRMRQRARPTTMSLVVCKPCATAAIALALTGRLRIHSGQPVTSRTSRRPRRSLRLSVAGADSPSFERVPQAGPQRIHFGPEGCVLMLPVVVAD